MMLQVDEKSREITTVECGPKTGNLTSPGKNQGSVIRERFAAQTTRQYCYFLGVFHAPVE